MRRPRVRFTVRAGMVVVAVAAVAAEGEALSRRSQEMRLRAASCTEQEGWARQLATEAMRPTTYAMTVDGHCLSFPAPDAETRRDAYLETARHFARMATKYRRAASRPWAGVAPDPPAPHPLPPPPAPNAPPAFSPLAPP